jgi:hypothetical protein
VEMLTGPKAGCIVAFLIIVRSEAWE